MTNEVCSEELGEKEESTHLLLFCPQREIVGAMASCYYKFQARVKTGSWKAMEHFQNSVSDICHVW